MSNLITSPATIIVSAEKFARWQKAKQAATAAAKEADALKAECGFPETLALAELLEVPVGGKGEAVIVDGNSRPVGKLSLFWKDEYVVKAGFTCRIS